MGFLADKSLARITVWTRSKFLSRRVNELAAIHIQNLVICMNEAMGPVSPLIPPSDAIYTVVDQMPEYPGGYEAMMQFIKTNLRYPASARRSGIVGTVYVTFVVGKDGTISDVKVIKSPSDDLSLAAIGVIQKMPPWIPGRQKGKLVRTRFVVPLKFSL